MNEKLHPAANHPNLAQLQKCNEKVQQLCLNWLLALDPEHVTEELINWLNATVEIIEKWVPQHQRNAFDTPEKISKLFSIIGHLYQLEEEVQDSAESPEFAITYELLSSNHIIDLNNSAQNLNMVLANHLLSLKQTLNSSSLLEKFDINNIKNLTLSQLISAGSDLPEFKRQLELFKKKYFRVNKSGALKPKEWVTNKNLLLAFEALSNAYQEAERTHNPEIINPVLKNWTNVLGLKSPIKSDFAKYCNQWLESHKPFVLTNKPSPSTIRYASQPADYWLVDEDINVGLTLLANQYQQAKIQDPTLPKLTFLPLVPLEQLNQLRELLNSISLRKPQSYVGIYNKNNHYVSYFINVRDDGKITVIIIDPSFHTLSKNRKMKEAFQFFKNAFPDADVVPLDITQQFNGSDCGICTLQNTMDIVNSLTFSAEDPFLKLKSDKLIINPLALTLNAEKFPRKEKEMVKLCVSTRKQWQDAFLAEKELFTIHSQLEDRSGPGYSLLEEGSYDFTLNISQFKKRSKLVFQEFTKSKAYKLLAKQVCEGEIDIERYQPLFAIAWQTFITKSRQIKLYNNSKLEEKFPGKLDKFILEETEFKLIKPNLFKRIFKIFMEQNKGTIFPNYSFVDHTGSFDTKKEEVSNLVEAFLENNQAFKVIFEKYKGGASFIFENVTKIANRMRLQPINLLSFKDQPLTYAMLQQCIDIWKIRKGVFERTPELIKKLQKLIDNRDEEAALGSELSKEGVTTLKVLLRSYLKTRPALLNDIVKALNQTKTLNTNNPHDTQLNDDQAANISLEKIQTEIESLDLDISIREGAIATIKALRYVQENLELPDEENPIYHHFERVQQGKTVDSLHWIPNLNTFICVHLEYYKTWAQGSNKEFNKAPAKESLTNLIHYFLGGYQKAKQYSQLPQFLSLISNTNCLEGRTRQAITWTATLGSCEKFDDLMEKVCNQATHYLLSMGKSLSLENHIKFISKHYEGRRFLFVQKIGEKDVVGTALLNKEIIKEYLQSLGIEANRIKTKRRKNLIDYYNNYNLKHFVSALEKAPLNTAGLNKLTVEGETLLIDACLNCKTEHVLALMNKKVHLHLKNKKGESAFEAACKGQDARSAIQILDLLFKQLPENQREEKAKSLLITAYLQRSPGILIKILSYITDTNFLSESKKELGNLTLLAHACLKERNAQVSALLKKEVINKDSAAQIFQIPKKDEQTFTTLNLIRLAIGQGNIELTNALLNAISVDNEQAKKEALKLIQFLLPYYSMPKANYQALAALLNHLPEEAAPLLNSVYIEETLLTQACLRRKKTAVVALLEKDVDIFVKNSKGQSPLSIVTEQGDAELALTILNYYKNKLEHVQSITQIEQPAKEVFEKAFEFKHEELFLTVGKFITDDKFKAAFFDTNFATLLAREDFFNEGEAFFEDLKETGFFRYLTKPFQADKLLELLKKAIKEKKPVITEHLLLLMKNSQELQTSLTHLLWLAYEESTPTIFKQLLSEISNFNLPGLNLPLAADNDHTYLTRAINEGKTEMVNLLLVTSQLDIDTKRAAKSPLEWAVEKGDVGIVAEILNAFGRQSLDKMRCVVEQSDILYLAYMQDKEDIFKELLSRVSHLDLPGFNQPDKRLLGGTFLQDNISNHGTDRYSDKFTEILLAKGVPSHQIHLIEYDITTIYTALFDHERFAFDSRSSKRKKIQNYLSLLVSLVDVDQKVKLVLKAQNEDWGHPGVQWEFSQLGALIAGQQIRMKESPNYGFSKLHQACQIGEVPQELLDNEEEVIAGCKQDSQTGRTAIHYLACSQQQSDGDLEEATTLSILIKNLLKHEKLQACLTVHDQDGRTPLHYACRSGAPSVVSELVIDKESVVIRPDRVGQCTPLHYACMRTDSELLVSKIIDVPEVQRNINLVDQIKNSALHYACVTELSPKSGLVRMLVEKGADCSLQNNEGDTPLHLACRTGSLAEVQELLCSVTAHTALLLKNENEHRPLDELNKRKGAEAARIKKYLLGFYKLVKHARKLEKENTPDCITKATAIMNLLSTLSKTDIAGQKQILNSLNIEDEQNDLFKRRPAHLIGFFNARKACKTKTAIQVEEFRKALAVY